MELILVALAGFFWWELIKLVFPWPMPPVMQPITISAVSYGIWAAYNYLPSTAFVYVFASAGVISILAYLFGNPSAGWVKKAPQKRIAPGSWPPGTKPGRKQGIPPL